MQALQLLSTVATTDVSSCWEKAVSSVTWAWDTVWDKGGVAINAAIFIFCRVISLFIPGVPITEILLCHAITVIQRKQAAYKEEQLSEMVTELTKKNETMAQQANKTQSAMSRALLENNLITAELDAVKDQLDLSYRERSTLIQIQAEESHKQRTDIKQTIHLLQREKEQLVQIVENQQRFLIEKESNSKLSEQFQEIKEAYQQQTITPAKWKKLLCTYEKHKKTYREMLQKYLHSLKEHDPSRIPIEGLLEISNDESEYQTGILELVELLHRGK